MATKYGILGLNFGMVFSSITATSKKKGIEEMKKIAQMYMLPEYSIVAYVKPKPKKNKKMEIYYTSENDTIERKEVKINQLVSTLAELADKDGNSHIIAMA